MNRVLSLLALVAILCGCAFSQSSPSISQNFGSSTPSSGLCQQPNVGSTFIESQDPANGYTGIFYCLQTGSPSLGQGAYSWVAMATQASTPTTGTITVANGKAAVISKSLTFTGTDGTTETFPTTSATIARTDAAQTFTGAQTFSSAPVIATITNTGTLTLPTNTGGIPVLYGCGATSGNATCANTSGGATARVITGLATLASNSAVISGISPAFTGTTTFSCTSNDTTTVGNPTKVVNTSSSSVTITDTTGASDVVAYSCIGY